MIEAYTNNLYIPPVMRMEMAKNDSLKRLKENQLLLEQKLNKKEAEDSTEEDNQNIDPEAKSAPAKPAVPGVPKKKTIPPAALNIDDRKNKKTTRIAK